MIIGLTGGSGTGKSTVSRLFAEKGYTVIDGDALSRKLCAKGMPTLKAIEEAFGADYILPSGELDRRKLGDLVFQNAEALQTLNRITHTAITAEVRRLLQNTDKAVIEGAALHETKIPDLCDFCVFVSCPQALRQARIMQRDGITAQYAQNRINAQKSDAYYRERCRYEIVNDGVQSLEAQLEELGLDETDF